jgi:hypothetical protein
MIQVPLAAQADAASASITRQVFDLAIGRHSTI